MARKRIPLARVKADLVKAETERRKVAVFHHFVLKNAYRLEGSQAAEICDQLGLGRSYIVDFYKMLALYQEMNRN